MTDPVHSEPVRQIIVDDDEIDLREYLYVLAKYKWSILGLTLLVAILAALVVFSMQPVYEASASLLIDTKNDNIIKIEQLYGLPTTNDDYFQTQVHILESRQLADQVIDKLDLPKNPEFDPTAKHDGFSFNPKTWLPKSWLAGDDQPAPTKNDLRNAVVKHFQDQLHVSPVRETRLINISFDSYSPKLAAEVPNALAAAYINGNMSQYASTTRHAASWINQRLDGLRKKVNQSEQALQAYRDKEKLIDVKGVDSVAAKQLDALTTQLVNARQNLSDATEAYRQVTSLHGQPISAYESLPAVLNDPLVNKAMAAQSDAQQQVSELSKRYGPKHPKMIAARAQLAAANQDVKSAVEHVINSVQKRYQVALAREHELEHSFAATKGDVASINRKEATLSSLERDVEANRDLYDTFLKRLKETDVAKDLKPGGARMVDPAVVPSTPAKPKKSLVILIALILGLTGSMVLAFTIEALDSTLKHSGDVEHKLHLPVLGILPRLSGWQGRDRKVLRYFSEHGGTNFAENIRTIRTGVLLSDIDHAKKIILVTSSVEAEGKSAVAVNLALAMAQLEKVLLIDADLRRPAVGKVFGLAGDKPGLSHFISGQQPREKCMYHFKNENLYVMPAGVVPPNPLELLSSERFRQGMEALRNTFQHIIIDSAPAVPVSDGVVLSKLANAVIYVIKADSTPEQVAQEGLKRLRHVDARVVGAVLNQVTPSKRPSRYGYHSADYHSYYGYYGYSRR